MGALGQAESKVHGREDRNMSNQVHVLLVDPDDRVADACREAFSVRHWEFSHVRNFLNALDVLETTVFDIVVLEVRLPDRMGTEAWRYIQAVHPGTAGILITDSPTLHHSIDAFDHGILAFWLKPLDMDALCELVQAAVTQRGGIADRNTQREINGLGAMLAQIQDALSPQRFFSDGLMNLGNLVQPDVILVYLLDRVEHAWANHFICCLSVRGRNWTPAESGLIERQMVEVAQSQQMVVSNPAVSPTSGDLGAFVAVPLMARNQVHGAIGMISRAKSGQSFTPTEVELIAMVGKALALELDNARLQREITN